MGEKNIFHPRKKRTIPILKNVFTECGVLEKKVLPSVGSSRGRGASVGSLRGVPQCGVLEEEARMWGSGKIVVPSVGYLTKNLCRVWGPRGRGGARLLGT